MHFFTTPESYMAKKYPMSVIENQHRILWHTIILSCPYSPEKSIFPHPQKFCRLVGSNAGIQYFLDIPIHNLIQLIQRQVYPMIRHPSLREVIRPDFLRAVARANLAAAQLRFPIRGFMLFNIISHAKVQMPLLYSEAGIFPSGCKQLSPSGNGSNVPRNRWCLRIALRFRRPS